MLRQSRILHNRRGMAIELAIGFMALVFALCAVLMTISVGIRVRDRNVTSSFNEYFMLDQAGELFVQAVQKGGVTGNAASAFTSQADVAAAALAEQQASGASFAAFTKNLTLDYEIKLYENSIESTANRDVHRFTLKIWSKSAFAAAGTAGEQLTPKLIVSIDRTINKNNLRNVQYDIINWSNQENQRGAYTDATNKIDPNSGGSWWWLAALVLLMLVVVVVCVVCLI